MPAERWAGWLRPKGGTWRRVCESDDWARCWDLLLAVPCPLPVGLLERFVIEAGRHPEQRERPR